MNFKDKECFGKWSEIYRKKTYRVYLVKFKNQ